MLILIGGSASGKSTTEKILCEKYGYKKIISYTTRQPRENEVNHIDYHFISVEDFLKKKEEGFFAETAQYNGWYYGTAKEDCTNDKVAVLTPHGMRQIKKMPGIDVFSVYFSVDRRDRLIKILQRKDNIEESKRRDGSDVGQFDGVEDEVNEVLCNDGYKYSPEEMAEIVNKAYNKHISENINKRMTILCDIDEVVNNLIEKMLKRYNRAFNDNLTLDDITDYDVKKFIKPECVDPFWLFCDNVFIKTLDIQPKAKEIIEWLIQHHNFYFVSATFPNHVEAKHEWLKENIPGYDNSMLIICKDKNLIHGDILIDDCLGNFDFEVSTNQSVRYNFIFDKPWNAAHKEDLQKTFRVHGWEEILEMIKKLGGNVDDI